MYEMNSMGTKPSSLILQLIFLLCSLTNHVTRSVVTPECSTSGNYTSTSSFETNLNKLLSTLPTNAVKNDWFFNDTVGEFPDQVYGLAMCHYDASSTESCTTCLTDVARNITVECPYSTTAILWYDECFIHYSNQNFFSIPSDDSNYWYHGDNISSDLDTFQKVVGDLMNKLTVDVVSSPKLVAVGEANYSSFQKVYGLAECTRDFSAVDCKNCLQQEEVYFQISCPGRIGCQVLGPNCYVRYEALVQFYNPISAPSPPPGPQLSPLAPLPPTEPNGSKGKNYRVTIIAVSFAIALLLVITASIVYLCIIQRKRRAINHHDKRSIHQDTTEPDFQNGTELEIFDFNTIQEATSNFSDENKLGEGGFGQVFKGTLQNGEELAVKRLVTTSKQGLTELKNEVQLIGRLKHRNLVQVIGYCIQEKEKLLCYEYLSNGSLDKILFGLVSHVWQHWSEGKVLELKDPVLPDTCLHQITICIHVGLLCVSASPEERPSILDIYRMLNSPSPSMLPPLPPRNPRD